MGALSPLGPQFTTWILINLIDVIELDSWIQSISTSRLMMTIANWDNSLYDNIAPLDGFDAYHLRTCAASCCSSLRDINFRPVFALACHSGDVLELIPREDTDGTETTHTGLLTLCALEQRSMIAVVAATFK